MNFHVLTLFPEMIMQGLANSITGRAMEEGQLHINAVNIRDYSQDKHKRVDDYTYGGGAGMLMQAQPVYDAWKSVHRNRDGAKMRTIYVTPQGVPFHQRMAMEFAECEDLVILCGHYEGIDERVLEEVVTDYVSIGDYVLTGGELAAMVMIDAISRLVPGVLGNDESAKTESFCGSLLEYPQYSRPVEWHGKRVPEVLMSGDKRKIETWRMEASVERTRERRPDLLAIYEQLSDMSAIMKKRDKRLHIDMTELIHRGRAQLIYWEEDEMLLRDELSGIFFHTYLPAEQKAYGSHKTLWEKYPVLLAEVDSICVHQEEVAQYLEVKYGGRISCPCYQAVYTPQEKLSVTGLYRTDGLPGEQGLVIRQLTPEYAETVAEWYHLVSGESGLSYVRSRIAAGAVYGAFMGEELAGFIAYHGEGSIGMLEVAPPYKRQHIGMALETYMINLTLERGWTPYGQIITDNDVSMRLQEKMGLYLSKGLIYWMHLNEKA